MTGSERIFGWFPWTVVVLGLGALAYHGLRGIAALSGLAL